MNEALLVHKIYSEGSLIEDFGFFVPIQFPLFYKDQIVQVAARHIFHHYILCALMHAQPHKLIKIEN